MLKYWLSKEIIFSIAIEYLKNTQYWVFLLLIRFSTFAYSTYLKMLIQTKNCNFLIEGSAEQTGCVLIKANSQEELQRFFGSNLIKYTGNPDYPFEVFACKQEFANALILMVKEIEYSDFDFQTLVTA